MRWESDGRHERREISRHGRSPQHYTHTAQKWDWENRTGTLTANNISLYLYEILKGKTQIKSIKLNSKNTKIINKIVYKQSYKISSYLRKFPRK